MNIEYHRCWSASLNQDMEFKVYGHAGKPVLVFPAQSGRFFEFEDFGMVEAVRELIDTGQGSWEDEMNADIRELSRSERLSSSKTNGATALDAVPGEYTESFLRCFTAYRASSARKVWVARSMAK